jgi:hypothetical protein
LGGCRRVLRNVRWWPHPSAEICNGGFRIRGSSVPAEYGLGRFEAVQC